MIQRLPIRAIAATGLLLAAGICFGEETNNVPSTQYLHELGLKQQPIGSKTSWTITTNSRNWIVYHMTNQTSGSNWIVYGGPVPIPLPYKFCETNSGITFFVEEDGRHITATNSGGKQIWRREPFEEGRIGFYRTTSPRIRYLGKTKQSENYRSKHGATNYVEVLYNSSQFGFMDVDTGDFFFGGQD